MAEPKLEQIAKLAREMKGTEQEIYDLEYQLKRKKEQHTRLSAVEIPELMAEINLSEFVLDNVRYVIKPVLDVKIPKDKMDDADKWLVANDHDGMVKNVITLPRGVDNYTVNKIIKFIHEQGHTCETAKTIHPQTLGKWAREMEMEGMVIPEDIFSVFRSNKTIIE